MNDRDYKKVFDHFTDLSQRYALGKIQHDALQEGLKKLIMEIVAAESEQRRKAAFWGGCAAGFVLMAASAAAIFLLWRHGLLPHWNFFHEAKGSN